MRPEFPEFKFVAVAKSVADWAMFDLNETVTALLPLVIEAVVTAGFEQLEPR